MGIPVVNNIVGGICGPFAACFIEPIKKHGGFLVYSTQEVKEKDDKMRQLNEQKQNTRTELGRAHVNTEVVSEHAEPWLKDVETLNDKCKSIEATGCFSIIKRYKVGRRSHIILKKIKVLEDRRQNIEFTHEQRPLAAVVTSTRTPTTSASLPLGTRDNFQPSSSAALPLGTQNNFQPSSSAALPLGTQNNFQPSTSRPVPSGTEKNFKSRDLVFNDVLQSLQSDDESQKMIALCGMCGVGKTMMMEQLKKAVNDSGWFDYVVKVVLDENTDPIAFQKRIAECIGTTDLKETDKNNRADRLRNRFEAISERNEKKKLVIMDNLWKEVDLKDVGLSPLPNHFKILFTSRLEHVCTRMGVEPRSIFNVHVLNDEEAKKLFFDTVGQQNDSGLRKIGEDIVKICGDLPQAIVEIANNLRGEIKEVWERTLKDLQDDKVEVLDKDIKMSYENLKSKDDEALFLLSALYPRDTDIPIDDLVMYGWGLKLFPEVTLADARNHAKICVNNLKRANILTRSDINGCIRIHNLFRGFVLSNSPQASIVNADNMSAQHANKPYKRILLKCTGMAFFPECFNYPDLSLLILVDADDLTGFPNRFHVKMEKLRVVSYKNFAHPLDPTTFQLSTKLRTLCLHSCQLTADISVLESLCNLEALSLANCTLGMLPSRIGNLKKLKLLDVNGCAKLCIDDDVFQNLEKLEELYMRASTGKHIRFSDKNLFELVTLSKKLSALELEFNENKAEPKDVTFRNLKRFRISIGCELKDELEDGQRYSFRNTLHITTELNKLLECKIHELFDKTEELKLQMNDIDGLQNVSMGQKFSELRTLHVSKCATLKCLLTPDMANNLKKLERLLISDCPLLKSLVGENSEISTVVTFEKLSFLSLKGLPIIESLCDGGLQLPELLEIKLDDIPHFTSIYPNNINRLSLLNEKVAIPKLQKLDICRMGKLREIWPCEITNKKKNVSMLTEIKVKECGRLGNLFPCNPWPLLNQLEEIEIESCGSIQELFNINFTRLGELEGCDIISSLRSIKVNDLRMLSTLWRITGQNYSGIRIRAFQNDGSIQISRCEIYKFTHTPPDADVTDFYLNASIQITNNRRTTTTSPEVDGSGDHGSSRGAASLTVVNDANIDDASSSSVAGLVVVTGGNVDDASSSGVAGSTVVNGSTIDDASSSGDVDLAVVKCSDNDDDASSSDDVDSAVVKCSDDDDDASSSGDVDSAVVKCNDDDDASSSGDAGSSVVNGSNVDDSSSSGVVGSMIVNDSNADDASSSGVVDSTMDNYSNVDDASLSGVTVSTVVKCSNDDDASSSGVAGSAIVNGSDVDDSSSSGVVSSMVGNNSNADDASSSGVVDSTMDNCSNVDDASLSGVTVSTVVKCSNVDDASSIGVAG